MRYEGYVNDDKSQEQHHKASTTGDEFSDWDGVSGMTSMIELIPQCLICIAFIAGEPLQCDSRSIGLRHCS